jgi:hypothetical protein
MLRGLAGIVKGTSYIERPNHWIALGKPRSRMNGRIVDEIER